MVRVLARDDRVLVGLADRAPVGARQLRGRVDRLAAARGEEDLRAVEREQPDHACGELLGLRRREAVVRLVRGERAHLLGGGVRELRAPVADVRVPERPGDVDQRVAGVVPHRRPLAADDRSRRALAEGADVRHRVPERPLGHLGDAIRVEGPVPWWLEEAPPDPEAPPLAGDLDADVAIVGAGYTGLWTALEVRRRDPSLRVVVLEAERAGFGPSGRNGGFCHGLWASLRWLRTSFGDEGALATATASSGVYEAVRALGDDVWPREGGMLKVATTEAQEAALDRAVRTAAELGVPEEAVPLSREEVAERCRSPVFRRGVWFRDGITVQPARLVRAVRRAALAAGATLHEGTRVTRIDDGVLRTEHGVVRAPGDRRRHERLDVRLAAGARARDAVRQLRRPHRARAASCSRRSAGPAARRSCDARMFIHYFRTTNDGRVLMGTGSGPIGRGGRIDARFFTDAATIARAEQGLRRLLPGLARRARRARVGRADRRLQRPPAVLRHGAAARGSTTALAIPATESARAGSAARSSPRSCFAPTTSGRGSRLRGSGRSACRRSRCARPAAPWSAERCSRRRRLTRRGGGPIRPHARSPHSRASSGCESGRGEIRLDR